MDVEFDLLQVCTRTQINLLWVRSHRLQHLRSSQAKKLWPHRTERIIYYIILDRRRKQSACMPWPLIALIFLNNRNNQLFPRWSSVPSLDCIDGYFRSQCNICSCWRCALPASAAAEEDFHGWLGHSHEEWKEKPDHHSIWTEQGFGKVEVRVPRNYLYHRYPWATSTHMLGRRHDFSGTSDLARPWAIPERAPKLSERAPRQHFKSQHLRCGPKWVYEIEWRPWSQKSSFCSFLLDLAGLYFGIHQKEGGKWRPWCDHDHGHAGRHLCGSWPRAPGWAYIQQSHRFDEELAAKGPGQLHPSFPETMQHVSSPIQLKRQQDKP